MRSTTIIVVFLVASLLISHEAVSFLVGRTFAFVDDFTYVVLDED